MVYKTRKTLIIFKSQSSERKLTTPNIVLWQVGADRIKLNFGNTIYHLFLADGNHPALVIISFSNGQTFQQMCLESPTSNTILLRTFVASGG